MNQSLPHNRPLFNEKVKPQFSQSKPDLILLRFTLENKLIGYASLYDFNWKDAHTKAFFLFETDRLKGSIPIRYGLQCNH